MKVTIIFSIVTVQETVIQFVTSKSDNYCKKWGKQNYFQLLLIALVIAVNQASIKILQLIYTHEIGTRLLQNKKKALQ